MGERLNIEIKENNDVLANAYYHWSGYTSSSLSLTQIILDNISKVEYKNRKKGKKIKTWDKTKFYQK